jgi:hypothetical protein
VTVDAPAPEEPGGETAMRMIFVLPVKDLDGHV